MVYSVQLLLLWDTIPLVGWFPVLYFLRLYCGLGSKAGVWIPGSVPVRAGSSVRYTRV